VGVTMSLSRDTRIEEKYLIFISYETGTGETWAKKLKAAINRQFESLPTYVAGGDLLPTDKIPDIISKYLSQCRIFIPIFTANANKSEAMLEEINYALKNKNQYKFIICQHEKVNSSDIPEEFNSYKKIRFNSPDHLANEVILVLEKLIGQHPHLIFDDSETRGISYSEDLKSMGICRIFPQRRNCQELDEIIREEIKKSNEIKIMANTARDFFGDETTKPKFYEDIIDRFEYWKEREKSIKSVEKDKEKPIKVILLNPFSEAAFDRYLTEYWGATSWDKKGLNNYIDSTFFRDIENVILWYAKNKMYHNFIELKFSSFTPTLFFIQTKNYTFIEFYHNSALRLAGIRVDKRDKGAICLGGYVPVLMIANTSKFGKLMDGHFDFSWDNSEEWKDTEIEIEKFKKDPKLYKLLYLISKINEKSTNIHLE
jgi:hypothetical protein